MTLNQLASRIAKVESKKHQASIGDIREILGILADMVYEDLMRSEADPKSYRQDNLWIYVDHILRYAGEKRAKKKP